MGGFLYTPTPIHPPWGLAAMELTTPLIDSPTTPIITRPSDWEDLTPAPSLDNIRPWTTRDNTLVSRAVTLLSQLRVVQDPANAAADRIYSLQGLLRDSESSSTTQPLPDMFQRVGALYAQAIENARPSDAPVITWDAFSHEMAYPNDPNIQLRAIRSGIITYWMKSTITPAEHYPRTMSIGECLARDFQHAPNRLYSICGRSLTMTQDRREALWRTPIHLGTFEIRLNVRALMGLDPSRAIWNDGICIESPRLRIHAAGNRPTVLDYPHPHASGSLELSSLSTPIPSHFTALRVQSWCHGDVLPGLLADNSNASLYFMIPNLLWKYLNTYGQHNPYSFICQKVMDSLVRLVVPTNRDVHLYQMTHLNRLFPTGIPQFLLEHIAACPGSPVVTPAPTTTPATATPPTDPRTWTLHWCQPGRAAAWYASVASSLLAEARDDFSVDRPAQAPPPPPPPPQAPLPQAPPRTPRTAPARAIPPVPAPSDFDAIFNATTSTNPTRTVSFDSASMSDPVPAAPVSTEVDWPRRLHLDDPDIVVDVPPSTTTVRPFTRPTPPPVVDAFRVGVSRSSAPRAPAIGTPQVQGPLP